MTIWIVVIAILLGVGLVLSQLFRMRDWLKNSPPLPPPIEFDDEKGDGDK